MSGIQVATNITRYILQSAILSELAGAVGLGLIYKSSKFCDFNTQISFENAIYIGLLVGFGVNACMHPNKFALATSAIGMAVTLFACKKSLSNISKKELDYVKIAECLGIGAFASSVVYAGAVACGVGTSVC